MLGLSHALVPAQESKRWSFGRLLLLPVIQKGLFLGPKKSRKIRHANTGLPSIAMALDKPLAEAQELVQDSDAFMRAITQIVQDKHSHPVTAQMLNPDVRDDLPPSECATGSSEGQQLRKPYAPP